MPSHTRTSKRSSSRHHQQPSQTAHVQEWADDGDSESDDARTHTRSDHHRRHHGASTPLAPPSPASLDDDLQDVAASHASAEHALGDWHYAPLILGLGPSLGAILGGKADHWSDAILLLLSCFWLYQCLKVPSDIYHAARTRRILQADQLADDRDPKTPHTESPERIRRRQLAIAELQRTEVLALLACVLSPLLGAYALGYLQRNLHDGQRYFNQFNIRLFMLAAGIRPWLHAFKLLKSRTLLLHEDVHYPSGRVEALQRRVTRLEADLASLRKSTVSRADINLLREGIDVPLSHLSRSIRRSEKKEEYVRGLAEDKFALVEARLEDLLRECAINAELIEAERMERERGSSFSRSIFEAFKLVVGHRRRDANANANTPAIAGRSFSSDGRALPSSSAAAAQMLGNNSSPPRGSGPPSPVWSKRHPLSSPPAQHPALYAPMPNRGADPGAYYDEATAAALLKYPPAAWYERGMAYYAFLPLNLTNSVLRYTGDVLAQKAPSVLAGAGASGERGRGNDRKMIGPPVPPGYGGGSGSASANGHGHYGHAYYPQQQQYFPTADSSNSPPRNASGAGAGAGGGTYHLSPPPMQLRSAASNSNSNSSLNFANQEAFSPFINGGSNTGGGGATGGASRSGSGSMSGSGKAPTLNQPLGPMNMNHSSWRKGGSQRGVKV